MSVCFVGFDTSNYTTSCAVADSEGNITASLKLPLPVREGERGLRQSDAVFEHTRNLPILMGELASALDGYKPIAVGVSVSPRSEEGSYMPCFLAGKGAAYAFATALGAPVYEHSHQDGHIMAALYSAGRLDLLGVERFLAFHVSGGTTEALLVTPKNGGFCVRLVGNTLDINGGQAIDRVGVSMGLRFPCGAELEALAAAYEGKIYSHPVCVRNGSCSLSGVENIAAKLYADSEDKNSVAAFVFDFLGRTLEAMCRDIIKKEGNMPVLFAGGVMSNKLMRDRLRANFDAYFSEPHFSSDNAAGIALLCRERYLYERQ